ncbi:M56 family metallopeptidase [Pedobacter foliorum]|uniref:M56 family metallopeptidase n=1 Tax=Pedobacter foliorum TaxID=2739058 RepID=UPI0015665925|nr:M56 family metallopeptidase [Pedobacter foliorum]NRF40084.1 M56 family metallopeptidase [Pedobacter foliorum]
MEKLISSYLPVNVTEAITYTLLHSLWEGMLLMVVVSLMLRLTERTAPVWRYRLLTGTLFVFALVLGLTFTLELSAGPDSSFKRSGLLNSGADGFAVELWRQLNFSLKYIHEHAGLVVLLWLLAIGIQICRLSLGFYVLQRMRVVKATPADPFWEQRLNELAGDLRIHHAVRLVESGIARIPMVLGYFKPLILIPVGLLNALDQDQVEAILLHELAHIRRKDGLINLMQTLMETLLFFNPAVWWLSSLIRAERENCCDEVAVQHLKSPVVLMRAMVCFEHYRDRKLNLALAFSTTGAGLALRMERLLTGKNRMPGKLDLLAIVLILVMGLLVMVRRPENQIHSLAKAPLSLGKPNAVSSHEALEDKKRAEADALRRTGRHPAP